MKYIHPAKYKGLKVDTPNNQLITKAFVETNCLKCDLFCGKDHDFSECDRHIFGSKAYGCTCPPECRRGVSLVQTGMEIQCESVAS